MWKPNLSIFKRMIRANSVTVPTHQQGYLGLVSSIPDEVAAVKNFLLIFGVQLAFSLDELLTVGEFPTVFEVCQATLTSLVITLSMYGLNKYHTAKEEAKKEEETT